ncbi:hypothetical protein AMJ80_01910 [bacterium SM23_31]|nr:MAG: hypothetical protein AMJ80_01910 [bacterium SM23_31]
MDFIAVELAPCRIRVNAIAPGVVETEALRYFSTKGGFFEPYADKMVREAKEKIPLKTLTTPADVARLALFLCGGHSLKNHWPDNHHRRKIFAAWVKYLY